MWCEACGADVETRQMSLHYNIGVIVVRFSGSTEGYMCKPCIHAIFWKYTAINLFLGWWGLISFFCTVGYLIFNTAQYVSCLAMKSPSREPEIEIPGRLSEHTALQLEPWRQSITSRYNAGVAPERIAADFGPVAGCSEEQVKLYIQALVEASNPA